MNLHWLLKYFPDLKLKLAEARLNDNPEDYLKKTITSAFFMSFILLLTVFFFIKKIIVIFFFPFIFLLMFFYFFNYVNLKIKKLRDNISKEIVFAGRFLLVELESGVPYFTVFKNMAKHYDYVGIYFQDIVDKVSLGTSMEVALNEVLNSTPSPELRKVFWQLLNSLKTGSSVTRALSNVFDQIVREQQIAVKEYGRKLNPLAMFYMMMAVIIPSLGTIMLVVAATFMGLSLEKFFLIIIVLIFWFIQFMFLNIIKNSRPPVEL